MSFPGYPSNFDPGWWRTQLIVPPVSEPVTIAQAKVFGRVQYADEDSAVSAPLLTASRECVEVSQGRALRTQVITIYFMGFPWGSGYYNRIIRGMGPNPWWLPTQEGIILLPSPPMQMVLSIGYLDPPLGTQNYVLPSNYFWANNSTPGRLQPQFGQVWPIARPQIDSVAITFVAGYGATSFGSAQSQTLAVQGVATSGTFTLTWNGQTTTALGWNSTAAQVATALQALGAIGATGVTCQGGPFPVAPIEAIWAGSLATGYQPLITATSALLGVTSSQPAVLTTIAPLFPSSTQIAMMQVFADNFENREATQSQPLHVTPAAERMMAVENWGSYL